MEIKQEFWYTNKDAFLLRYDGGRDNDVFPAYPV